MKLILHSLDSSRNVIQWLLITLLSWCFQNWTLTIFAFHSTPCRTMIRVLWTVGWLARWLGLVWCPRRRCATGWAAFRLFPACGGFRACCVWVTLTCRGELLLCFGFWWSWCSWGPSRRVSCRGWGWAGTPRALGFGGPSSRRRIKRRVWTRWDPFFVDWELWIPCSRCILLIN